MKMTDPRDLIQRLSDSIELLLEMRPVDAKPMIITEARLAEARAYLAQPEPAVVPTESTSMAAWQWYSYCPEEGIELHMNRALAKASADEIMGSFAKAAHSDGWHEDMEAVSWGMLVPIEQAHCVEQIEAEPDSEFDKWVRYELRPSLVESHFLVEQLRKASAEIEAQ